MQIFVGGFIMIIKEKTKNVYIWRSYFAKMLNKFRKNKNLFTELLKQLLNQMLNNFKKTAKRDGPFWHTTKLRSNKFLDVATGPVPNTTL